jgi:hypothetical protein
VVSLCEQCINKQFCKNAKVSCAAIDELINIYKTQSFKRRTILTKLLARRTGIRDAEPSKELKQLGEAIIDKFPELHFINTFGIKIGYVLSYENKGGQKITFADCRKIGEVYKAYLPFDVIVTFYYYNTEMLNKNQKQILMEHELKHIQMTERGLTIRPHDIEDFKDILAKYGNDWNESGKEVPDILGGE